NGSTEGHFRPVGSVVQARSDRGPAGPVADSLHANSRRRREPSIPEIDLRQAGDPERLVELGDVIDVVAEDALDDGAAGVHPRLVPVWTADLLVEHVEGPSVEAGLDDPEGGVEGRPERSPAEHVLEVVVARAVVAGVGE